MKRCSIFIISFLLSEVNTQAQQMTFSDYSKKDTRDIYFEILGKFDSSYVIYKNIRQKHVLTKYDKNMHIIENIPLSFVPDRTFNIDFISYRDYCYMIYQYQRNSIIYCKAMKLNLSAKPVGEPVLLDTTKISILADNKIYTTIVSEDKQRILVYKRQFKNEVLTLATRLYNADLSLLDSTRESVKFDDRKEVYSDLALGNNGYFLFAKETWKYKRKDNSSDLEVIVHKPGVDSFRNYKLKLGSKLIEEIVIKVDNLNKHYIINAFYYGQRRGSIEGLFTSLIDMNGEAPIRAAFNVFSDSLRYKLNSSDRSRFVFDNLVIRNTIVKKNGGFVVSAEDFYTETLYNNAWNRQYYSNTLPYVNSYDYYLSNPYYYGYRPFDGTRRDESNRYYYDDVVVLSVDSSLKLEWNNIIHKTQYDVDNDNFLSFANMNAGGEVHFLFLDKDRQKQVISNQSISPTGEVKRYPTLRSNETGYGFMPRLAKQTGARQMIIPCVYLSYIAFAKIDF
ncbi:MAG: hypothetical protein H7258_14385 [Ferruginibacter sp.]|nr:hypothetical protein [Ferruginibacter sp.]